MAVHIISTAAQLDIAAGTGGAGLDIWSSAPDVSEQQGMMLDAPCEIYGVVGMLVQGLRRVQGVAMPGDVIQIAIPGGEAALDCFRTDPRIDALGQRAYMSADRMIDQLQDSGVDVRWLEPVRNHSGIAHARVEAGKAMARMTEVVSPRLPVAA